MQIKAMIIWIDITKNEIEKRDYWYFSVALRVLGRFFNSFFIFPFTKILKALEWRLIHWGMMSPPQP
jgi:hypothetical protein